MHHQKYALFGSEIRVESSHSIFCTNRHKLDRTTVLQSGGAKDIHARKIREFSMLHRHLISSFFLLVQQAGTNVSALMIRMYIAI